MSIASESADRRRPEFGVGDRLRKAREMTGLEKAEFADLVGIHRDSLSKYEAGRAVPRRPVAVAWSLATGVDLDWIAGGDPACARWGSNPRPADYKVVASRLKRRRLGEVIDIDMSPRIRIPFVTSPWMG